jgi:hypothetical protein
MSVVRDRIRKRAQTSVSKEVVHKVGREIIHQEEAETKRAPLDIGDLEHPAYLEVGGGVTRNMGDFNSVRINVSLRMPCRTDDVSIQAAFSHLTTMVDTMVDEALEEAQARG